MSSGIYCIENLVNGWRLVASAKDLDNGIREAWHKLQCGKYWCSRLQTDFGQQPSQFQVEVLEVCEPDQLQERKKAYIETWLPQYNFAGMLEKCHRQGVDAQSDHGFLGQS